MSRLTTIQLRSCKCSIKNLNNDLKFHFFFNVNILYNFNFSLNIFRLDYPRKVNVIFNLYCVSFLRFKYDFFLEPLFFFFNIDFSMKSNIVTRLTIRFSTWYEFGYALSNSLKMKYVRNIHN